MYKVEIDRSGSARVLRLIKDDRLVDTHSALEAGGAHYERFYDALADRVEEYEHLCTVRAKRIEELENTIRALQKQNADHAIE